MTVPLLIRRGVAATVIVGLAAVGFALDRNTNSDAALHSSTTETASAVGVRMSAKSSAWYCPVTTSTNADPSLGSIFVVNLGGTPITGTATFFPMRSPTQDAAVAVVPVERPLSVGPHARLALRPADVVNSDFAATLVRLDSGAGAVEHVFGRPTPSIAACSTTPSKQWFLADGATGPNDGLKLGLFNPFPEDAIADVKFMTNEGSATPADFQGVVIPGRSLVVADVTAQVRRRDWVATNVAVRTGRLVVEQLQTGEISGAPGFSLTTAAPSTSNTWYFPDSAVGGPTNTHLDLYNPNDTEADVFVQTVPQDGDAPDPFNVHVPANNRIELKLEDEPRVSHDTRFATIVRSDNVPIVVSQTSTAVAPAEIPGAFSQMGAESPALGWAFAVGNTQDPFDEGLFVLNPGTKPAHVKVTLLDNGTATALPTVATVDPGKRFALHLDDVVPNGAPAVLISSDQPVVSGRLLQQAGALGISNSIGIPLQ